MQTEYQPPTETSPPAKQGESESYSDTVSTSEGFFKKEDTITMEKGCAWKVAIKHIIFFEPRLKEKKKKEKRKVEKKFDCHFCHKLFKHKSIRTRHIEKMSFQKNKKK